MRASLSHQNSPPYCRTQTCKHAKHAHTRHNAYLCSSIAIAVCFLSSTIAMFCRLSAYAIPQSPKKAICSSEEGIAAESGFDLGRQGGALPHSQHHHVAHVPVGSGQLYSRREWICRCLHQSIATNANEKRLRHLPVGEILPILLLSHNVISLNQ